MPIRLVRLGLVGMGLAYCGERDDSSRPKMASLRIGRLRQAAF